MFLPLATARVEVRKSDNHRDDNCETNSDSTTHMSIILTGDKTVPRLDPTG
jgi:hypothetical protein